MRASKLAKRYSQELIRTCLSYDVDKFKKFYYKWESYMEDPLPNDDRVIEIIMRKIVCNSTIPSDADKMQAAMWLAENGFSAGLIS